MKYLLLILIKWKIATAQFIIAPYVQILLMKMES